jgi:ribose transport system substrate-binding protein
MLRNLKSILLALAPMVLVTALLVACDLRIPGGPEPVDPNKRYKIGFANLTEELPFTVRVREGIEKAAKDAGNVDLVLANNDLDGVTALANADEFVREGVEGVIEFPVNEQFDTQIVDKLKAKNIPVMTIDVAVPGATLVGADNYRAGFMAGEGLGNYARQKWDGKVDALVMLELPESGAVPAERMRGQREGLESVVGKIEDAKVKHLDSKNTLDEARKQVTAALAELPDTHRIAVVAINDDTALGAIRAAEAAERTADIAVVSQGADEKARAEIRKAGTPLVGSTLYSPEKYGEKAIPGMVKLLRGEALPEKIFIEHVFVSKENVDKLFPDDPKP